MATEAPALRFLGIVLISILFLPSVSPIVFKVKARNSTATLEVLPTTSSSTSPPTTSSVAPTPHPPKPEITRRRYINDDYFSTLGDLPLSDPWQTQYLKRDPFLRAPVIEPNPLLQLLLAHNGRGVPKNQSERPRRVMPLYWGLAGYGLYSYSAGNDLHNNQPIGVYKHVKEY